MLSHYVLLQPKRNSVKGNCAKRSDIDADDLALCGVKDNNGKFVDEQVCLCEADLCNAMWKNSKDDQISMKNSAAHATCPALALVSIFSVLQY